MTTGRHPILGSSLTAGDASPLYELLSTGRTEAAQAERWTALQAIFSAPHVDAELLELGRQREAVVWTIDNARGLSDEDAARLGDEWLALDRQIMEAAPQTVAGLAVQLAVVWGNTDLLPGEDKGPTDRSSQGTRWLWQAMQNARRIGGAA